MRRWGEGAPSDPEFERGFGADGDGDFDLLPEATEDGHQAVNREAAEFRLPDAREFTVGDPGQSFRPTGGQALRVEDLSDEAIAALETAEMDPRHAHLDALMDT